MAQARPPDLSDIQTGTVQVPTRTMMYGEDGVGKSTWASEAPNPIFICTEDGVLRIDVPKFPLCQTWPEVFGRLAALGTQKHEYKTLVLDSADWAQELAIRHIIDTQYGGDVDKFSDYGKGYRPLMTEWVKMLAWMDRLRMKRGMEIILLAHALRERITDPQKGEYDVFQANLVNSRKTSIWAKTKEWCDIVLFARFDTVVTATDSGSAKRETMKKTQDGQAARIVYAAKGPGYETKVRAGWSLPNSFGLSQANFRKYLKGDA